MYVLFTSGSTGQPKGVPGFESGVIRRLAYWWSAFPYASDEVTLHHITYNWVDHVMEAWNTLLAGRELIIVPDVAVLLERIFLPPPQCRRLWLVASVLRAVLDRAEASHMQPPLLLFHVVVTGEALPANLLERYQRFVSGGRVLNVYGMTEVRVFREKQPACSLSPILPPPPLAGPRRLHGGHLRRISPVLWC